MLTYPRRNRNTGREKLRRERELRTESKNSLYDAKQKWFQQLLQRKRSPDLSCFLRLLFRDLGDCAGPDRYLASELSRSPAFFLWERGLQCCPGGTWILSVAQVRLNFEIISNIDIGDHLQTVTHYSYYIQFSTTHNWKVMDTVTAHYACISSFPLNSKQVC